MSSCGTLTAWVLWQFPQYVRVWQAPQVALDGSTLVTWVLWLNTHNESRCDAGRSPIRMADVPLPIWGNVWQVAQADGIASLVRAPSTTLKWPPSWQRRQPG